MKTDRLLVLSYPAGLLVFQFRFLILVILISWSHLNHGSGGRPGDSGLPSSELSPMPITVYL